MKKYPFVMQRGLKDCGPACTLMILKYFGGYVNLDKLSVLLCTNKNGTTAYHITDVLRSLGFNCNGYKYDDISFLKAPSILHINYNSYNHYVVLYEVNYKRKYLLIADPSKGIYKIKFNDFLSIWTGISINMTPKDKIVNEGEEKAYKFIFKLIRPNIKYLLSISILSLFIVILSIFTSFFMQAIITYIKINNTLLLIFLIFTFSYLLKVFIILFRNILLIKLDKKLDEKLSLDTFYHILNLPYHICKVKTAGEITSYFNDLFLIRNLVSHASITWFTDIPIIIFLTIILFFIHYHLFALNMFILSLYYIVHYFFKTKIHYLSDEVLRSKAKINSFIVESVRGLETIKNLNILDKHFGNFKNKYLRYLSVNNRYDKLLVYESFLKETVEILSILLIILYGIFNLKNGLPVSMFITLFLLSSLLNSSFKNILSYDFELEKVKSSINHINQLLVENDKKNVKCIKGDIVLENVSYSFDREKYALKNIDLTISSGSKVIVGGSSGSGKSTLFKIIKGYYDDYHGSSSIDGFESKKYNFANVVYVSEREILFSGIVKDNLDMIKYNSKNNYICELYDFVNDNRIIEEDGFNISSGQRQRIALARALSDFNVLIIDEGLSDVDIMMERRILEGIIKKYNDKTIIFISHRLDNLDLFDRFIKIESGKVVLDYAYND